MFALAGFIKGVIGMGLPTISMGLLAIVMPPVEAAGSGPDLSKGEAS